MIKLFHLMNIEKNINLIFINFNMVTLKLFFLFSMEYFIPNKSEKISLKTLFFCKI